MQIGNGNGGTNGVDEIKLNAENGIDGNVKRKPMQVEAALA